MPKDGEFSEFSIQVREATIISSSLASNSCCLFEFLLPVPVRLCLLCQESLLIYQNFFKTNKVKPTSTPIQVLKVTHPALQEMTSTFLLEMQSDSFVQQLADADADSQIKIFMEKIATSVYRSMPDDMVHFVNKLCEAFGKDASEGYAQLSDSG